MHKHYRRFCHQIIDVDEWGQIAMLNVLLHYARTQFLDPNAHEGGEQAADGSKKEKAFYSDDEEEQEEGAEKTNGVLLGMFFVCSRHKIIASNTIDPDLRLLLTSVNPLLNSRNAGVIVGVAMIYYHLAPREELSKIAKPLTRLLGSHREVQYVVLSNIAVIAAKAPVCYEIKRNESINQRSCLAIVCLRAPPQEVLCAVLGPHVYSHAQVGYSYGRCQREQHQHCPP